YVGGVDEIDARLARGCDDAPGFVERRLFAEHHGTQAQRGNAQVAGAEAAVFHGGSPSGVMETSGARGRAATAYRYRARLAAPHGASQSVKPSLRMPITGAPLSLLQ